MAWMKRDHTIYVSPVPFDQLKYDTGKGKPHLNPVKDTMADGSNLAMAMIVAPVAAAAAAFGKLYKHMKEEA